MNFNDKTKRKFMVINEKGEHEYNIIVSEETSYGRTYELISSEDERWNTQYKNKLLLTMTDTGNGIQFDRDVRYPDYSLTMYMRILLTFDSKIFSPIENKFKIIEEASIIEL